MRGLNRRLLTLKTLTLHALLGVQLMFAGCNDRPMPVQPGPRRPIGAQNADAGAVVPPPPPGESPGHEWCRRAGGVELMPPPAPSSMPPPSPSSPSPLWAWSGVWAANAHDAWLLLHEEERVPIGDAGGPAHLLYHPYIVHWDGRTLCSTKVRSLFPAHRPSGNPERLDGPRIEAIWGSSAADVWFGGDASLARWNGRDWQPVTIDGQLSVHVRQLTGSGPSDLYALSSSSTSPVMRWDGTSWTAIPIPSELTDFSAAKVQRIWVDESRRVWWQTEVAYSRDRVACNVYVVDNGLATCLLTLGRDGYFEVQAFGGIARRPWVITLIHEPERVRRFAMVYQDGSWQRHEPTAGDAYSVRAFAPDDVWIAGERRTERWDGNSWIEVPYVSDEFARNERRILSVTGGKGNYWAIAGTSRFRGELQGGVVLRGDGSGKWTRITP